MSAFHTISSLRWLDELVFMTDSEFIAPAHQSREERKPHQRASPAPFSTRTASDKAPNGIRMQFQHCIVWKDTLMLSIGNYFFFRLVWIFVLMHRWGK